MDASEDGMTEGDSARIPSEVAMWHLLSGTPDNVTEDGQVVQVDAGTKLRSEKELLRAAIEELRAPHRPDEVRALARLAASYLLAGDAETSSRYVTLARNRLAEQGYEDKD